MATATPEAPTGQSKDANNTSKEALKNFYEDNIVGMKLGPSGGDTEIIDIVSDFPWTANPVVGGTSGTSFSHNIPYCYVIERKQTVNSSIANFINTLKIGIDSVLDTAEQVGQKLGVESTGSSNMGSSGGDNPISTTPEAQASTPTEQADNTANANANTNGEVNNDANATKTEGDKSEHPNGNDNNPKPDQQGEKKEEDKTTAERIKSGAESLLKTISSIKDQYETYVNNFLSGVVSDQLASNLLSPYRYLYYTTETGKKFIFPMLTPTELLNVNNTYGNDTKSFDFGGIGEFAKKAAESLFGGQMIMNFLDQVSGSKYKNDKGRGMEEMYAEMAKSFSYDTNGQELTINFPLFNTVNKGDWRMNYQFIQGFVLRNLPFKVSAYSYKPPLLYDVIVPGTTHLPLCYVSSIQVQHYGLIRMLKMNNYVKDMVDNSAINGRTEAAKAAGVPAQKSSSGAAELHVPVPEAWLLTIKFKCLLSNSANLMLDLANSPINISIANVGTVGTTNYSKPSTST